MEISPEKDSDEGELSIRLLDNADMYEVMKILGDVFKELGYKEAKNITIQYEFDQLDGQNAKMPKRIDGWTD